MAVRRLKAFAVLALFSLMLLAKAWLVRAYALEDASILSALLNEGPLILLVLLVVDAFFADMRLKALYWVDAVISVFLLAVAMYTAYYGQLPSVESLKLIGQATTVGQSIAALFRPAFLLFIIDVPIAWFVLKRQERLALDDEDDDAEPDFMFQHWATYAVVIPALVLTVLGVVAVRAMPSYVDGIAASKQRGIIPYMLATSVPNDTKGPRTSVNLQDPAAVQRAIDGFTGARKSLRHSGTVPGQAKGMNVVLIQVEALQVGAVGARIAGQRVTPNLDALVSRSWYFPNAVSQVGRGTTSDAEFISATSLYPSLKTASALDFSSRVLPSLPRLLGEEGYDTYTFHTNDVAYWNRSQLYEALGFGAYYDKEFFGDEDRIAFGASDEVLFDKTLDELVKSDKAGHPFYAQIITMSTHHPFTGIPKSKLNLRLEPPYVGTTTGAYLSAVEYFDRALGAFLADLKEAGLADDTIIVLYGDHFGLEEPDDAEDKKAQEALFGAEPTVLDKMRIPLIVHVPGQTEGRRLEDTVGQIDIMPTVADLLGVDLAKVPHFGRSVFVKAPVLIAGGGYMPPGTYLDENVFFRPGVGFDDGQAFSVSGNRKVALGSASSVKWERMRNLITISDAYTRALPARPDYKKDAVVILPE